MGVCSCYCCAGKGCEGSFISNFTASAKECVTTKCTDLYPVSCARNTTIGGQIRVSFDPTQALTDAGSAYRFADVFGWILMAVFLIGVVLYFIYSPLSQCLRNNIAQTRNRLRNLFKKRQMKETNAIVVSELPRVMEPKVEPVTVVAHMPPADFKPPVKEPVKETAKEVTYLRPALATSTVSHSNERTFFTPSRARTVAVVASEDYSSSYNTCSNNGYTSVDNYGTKDDSNNDSGFTSVDNF
ncbi:hypothetical protein EDD86DRAFT_214061 [Gorgonomyces haynaldii]|nr:hypothetical protein EDD86DRAFT_214061 [Gorgonomyces haynaldii]